MCNRQKPITKAEVDEIQIQMKTRAESLVRLTNKLTKQGLTQDERELAKEHIAFIEANKKIVKEFYKPAMIIDP